MANFLRPAPYLLIGFLFLTGCSVHGAGVIGRSPHTPSTRQIERDARSYVQHLDRYLRLDRRQRRAIEARLVDRTVHLMRTTRAPHRHRVYPFPREYGDYQNRTVRRWWSNADRDIERILSRRQREEFRHLKRDGSRVRDRRDRRNDRGPSNRRGRGRFLDGAVQLEIAPRQSTAGQADAR